MQSDHARVLTLQVTQPVLTFGFFALFLFDSRDVLAAFNIIVQLRKSKKVRAENRRQPLKKISRHLARDTKYVSRTIFFATRKS